MSQLCRILFWLLNSPWSQSAFERTTKMWIFLDNSIYQMSRPTTCSSWKKSCQKFSNIDVKGSDNEYFYHSHRRYVQCFRFGRTQSFYCEIAYIDTSIWTLAPSLTLLFRSWHFFWERLDFKNCTSSKCLKPKLHGSTISHWNWVKSPLLGGNKKPLDLSFFNMLPFIDFLYLLGQHQGSSLLFVKQQSAFS